MGYLDQYDQRNWLFSKLVKAVGWTMLAAIVLYSFYWLFFRNWREERRVENFLAAVQERQFEDAYSYWGCTVAEPCRFYDYNEFLEDWGPESPLASVSSYELGRSYTQPNGVIVEVTINGEKQPNLWVEKDTQALSYFPY